MPLSFDTSCPNCALSILDSVVPMVTDSHLPFWTSSEETHFLKLCRNYRTWKPLLVRFKSELQLLLRGNILIFVGMFNANCTIHTHTHTLYAHSRASTLRSNTEQRPDVFRAQAEGRSRTPTGSQGVPHAIKDSPVVMTLWSVVMETLPIQAECWWENISIRSLKGRWSLAVSGLENPVDTKSVRGNNSASKMLNDSFS